MNKKLLFSINGILLCGIIFLGRKRYQTDNVKIPSPSCEIKHIEAPAAVLSGTAKEVIFWDIKNPHKQAFFHQLKTLKLQSGKEKMIAYYGGEELKKKIFNYLKLIPLTFEETVAYFKKQGISLTEEQKEQFRYETPFIYDFGNFYIGSCANGQYGGAGVCLPEKNKPFSFLYNYEKREVQEDKTFGGIIIQKKGEKEWFPLFQVKDQYHFGPYVLRVESGVIYVAVSTPGGGSPDYVLHVYRLEEKESKYAELEDLVFSPVYHGTYIHTSPGFSSGTLTEEQIDVLVAGDSILIDDQGRDADPRILEVLRKENDDVGGFGGWFDTNFL